MWRKQTKSSEDPQPGSFRDVVQLLKLKGTFVDIARSVQRFRLSSCRPGPEYGSCDLKWLFLQTANTYKTEQAQVFWLKRHVQKLRGTSFSGGDCIKCEAPDSAFESIHWWGSRRKVVRVNCPSLNTRPGKRITRDWVPRTVERESDFAPRQTVFWQSKCIS